SGSRTLNVLVNTTARDDNAGRFVVHSLSLTRPYPRDILFRLNRCRQLYILANSGSLLHSKARRIDPGIAEPWCVADG
ncbi:hypothetical protein M404DRAFT_997110, partial [Pisolithus tinctorius Marx 270]